MSEVMLIQHSQRCPTVYLAIICVKKFSLLLFLVKDVSNMQKAQEGDGEAELV